MSISCSAVGVVGAVAVISTPSMGFELRHILLTAASDPVYMIREQSARLVHERSN
ncbi:hypothetical protein GCM10028801_09130 [Nocardioides maradonensis]